MRLVALLCIAGCGSTANEWWPLRVGDRWTMRNAETGSSTFFAVLPAPALCESPQFVIRITKDSVDTYWGAGGAMSIDWSLRLDPDGSIRSPLARWYGTVDATGPVTLTWRTPQNLIVPAAPTDGFTFEAPTEYRVAEGEASSCDAGSVFGEIQWRTKAVLRADELRVQYVEGDEVTKCNGFGEVWTFRRHVGLVKIEYAERPSCRIVAVERT